MKKRNVLKVTVVICFFISVLILNAGNCLLEVKANSVSINNPVRIETDSEITKTWDCIYFGNYYQDKVEGSEDEYLYQPIKWIVLSVNGDDAYLISDNVLDKKEYDNLYVPHDLENDWKKVEDSEKTSYSWETSSLRKWLNNDFYHKAFNENEQKAIIEHQYDNNEYDIREYVNYEPRWDELYDNFYTESGEHITDQRKYVTISSASSDRVSMLTAKEAYEYEVYCYNQGAGTDYAGYGGVYVAPWRTKSLYLHTSRLFTGKYYTNALIGPQDKKYLYGTTFATYFVDKPKYGIRPVIHVDLSSNEWTYAGKKTSIYSKDDEIIEDDKTEVKSGITCKPTITIKEGQSVSINARIYATDEETLYNNRNEATWGSGMTSIATISNEGGIVSAAPSNYTSSDGEYQLWWSYERVIVIGVKEGTTYVIGKLPDGTSVSCQVTVEKNETDEEVKEPYLKIGDNATGIANNECGLVFPVSWTMTSSLIPIEMKTSFKKDGTYVTKGVIGGKLDYCLKDDNSWMKYKTNCLDNYFEYKDLCERLKEYGVSDKRGLFSTENSGWNPTLSVAGFYENTYDKNGNLINSDRGVNLGMSASFSFSQKFLTCIGPLYLNESIEPKINFIGTLNATNTSSAYLDGALKPSIAVKITGGYGIEKVASISGSGELNMGMECKNNSSVCTAKATASINAYIAFIIDETASISTPEFTLWDTRKGINCLKTYSAMKTSDSSTETSSLITTDFADKKSKWSGEVKEDKNNVIQEGVLPSTLPLIKEINGKQVMVWQAYNEERNTANSAMLMYSVLENGTWSTPTDVYDDGYGDLYADLQVINGKLCLTWQKQKIHLADIEDTEILLEQMSENSEIYYAEFDSENNKFTNITQVTENCECDSLPQFVKNTDQISIAYLRNDAKSMTQENGKNSIYQVKIDNQNIGNEELVCISPGTINNYTVYENNNKIEAMYITNANGFVAIMNSENRQIDELDSLMMPEKDGTISSVNYENKAINVICNGSVYSYNPSTEEVNIYKAGTSAIDNTAKYCTNGTKSGYVWSQYDEGSNKGSIIVSMKTDEGYSEPITLYEMDGKVPRYMSTIITSEGDWNVVLNQEDMNTNVHSLCYLEKDKVINSEVLFAEIYENDIVDGKTAIEYSLKNTGDSIINGIVLRLIGDDGANMTETINIQVNPGQVVSDTIYVDLSNINSGQNVGIFMWGKNEETDEKNPIKVEYSKTDISLVGTATEKNGKIQINVIASNEGNEDTTTEIVLYSDESMTKQMVESKIIDVKSGLDNSVTFNVGKDMIEYNDNDAAYLTVKAIVEGGDSNTDNNVIYLVLYKGEIVSANTAIKTEDTENESTPGVENNTTANAVTEKQIIDTRTTQKVETLNKIGKPVISTASKKKSSKKISIKLKSKVNGAKGYVVKVYSSKKNAKKNRKKLFTYKTKKNNATIKFKKSKIKNKTILYIRVAAYKKVNGKVCMGKWSKYKKVKIIK